MKRDVDACCSSRRVLWYLAFSGFAINYMVRINMNIAIVAMVRQSRPTAHDSNATAPIVTSECLATRNETTSTSTTPAPSNESGDFDWNANEQGMVLGAFFWLHWSTQVPGGLLAKKYGTKLVFGSANFVAILLCVTIPFAATTSIYCLIFVRILQGVSTGFTWPAMHNMTAQWIPPNERGRFVSAYLGSSIGAALTFFMCGYIIAWSDWTVVFYVCGAIGVVWYICWCLFAFDSPAQHPRIDPVEREFIADSLGDTVSKELKKAPVPWSSILTSVPVWINILAQWGGLWSLFTVMTLAPSYFKQIHGTDIRSTGLMSGFPLLMRTVFSYAASSFGDFLLRTDRMKRNNVRKLATTICTIGKGICMMSVGLSGCDHVSAFVFLTLATMLHGAVTSGPLPSFVDISPNYAGVTFGICNTIVAFVGFLTPAIVGVLTLHEQTVARWQWVFYIATGWLMLAGTMYLCFSSSDIQPWNTPEKRTDEETVHLNRNGKETGTTDEAARVRSEEIKN